MGRRDFYKGKFLIAIYDDNDNFIDVFDNNVDMAKRLGLPRATVDSALSRVARGDRDGILYKGVHYNIHTIPLTKKEQKEFLEIKKKEGTLYARKGRSKKPA
jgi:hypothetical protein